MSAYPCKFKLLILLPRERDILFASRQRYVMEMLSGYAFKGKERTRRVVCTYPNQREEGIVAGGCAEGQTERRDGKETE